MDKVYKVTVMCEGHLISHKIYATANAVNGYKGWITKRNQRRVGVPPLDVKVEISYVAKWVNVDTLIPADREEFLLKQWLSA